MWTTSSFVLILAAYLWGSLSPSHFAARWRKGIDLRHYGSGNIGGSNLGEQLGWAWTIAVGVLDVLKGFVPAALARAWGFDLAVVVIVGIATVIGHNWSLYLGFVGGRGMSPTLGVLAAWDVRLALVLLLAMGIGWVIKQGAPGSLVGLMLLAPAAWLLHDAPEIILANGAVVFVIMLKRLEANHLPLPKDTHKKRAVLLRRLWMDRDVPADQPWQERQRFD